MPVICFDPLAAKGRHFVRFVLLWHTHTARCVWEAPVGVLLRGLQRALALACFMDLRCALSGMALLQWASPKQVKRHKQNPVQLDQLSWKLQTHHMTHGPQRMCPYQDPLPSVTTTPLHNCTATTATTFLVADILLLVCYRTDSTWHFWSHSGLHWHPVLSSNVIWHAVNIDLLILDGFASLLAPCKASLRCWLLRFCLV